MIIKRLKLKNFAVFKSLELDFEDKDIIGIVGKNQSGKTWIVESIYFALSGKSRRQKLKDIISYGEPYASVELILSENNEDFLVKRSVDQDSVSKLEFGGHDKIAAAQEAINSLIGITPSEFELTSFFKAGEINKFMNLSSPEKKEYLMKWFNRQHWKQLEELVDADNKVAKQRIKDFESKISMLNNLATNSDDIDDRIKVLKDQLMEVKTNLSQKMETVAKLQSKNTMTQREYDDLKFESETLEHDITRLSECISYNKYAVRLEEVQASIQVILESGAYKSYEKNKGELQNLRLSIKNLIQDKAVVTGKLELAKRVSKGICPVLNTACDKVRSSPLEIERLLSEVGKFNNKIRDVEIKIKTVESMESTIDNLTTLRMNESSLKKDVERIKIEIDNLPRLKMKHENMIKKLLTFNEDVAKQIGVVKREVSILQSQMDSVSREIGSWEGKLVDIEKNRKLVEEYSIKLAEIVAHVEHLTFLGYMFGKNGIPSLEIENGFVSVQDEVNFCLNKLGQNISIELSPERELGKWELVCGHCGFMFPKGYRKENCEKCESPRVKQRRDEISFNIIETDGNITEFEGISTGGQTLISLSIRTVLSQLLRKNSGSRLNSLFLDEIDAPLDPDNVIHARDFITKILREVYGYEQIFWVSHNQNIKECISNTLLVTKDGTSSTVEWI